jgi:hypothetical protein
MMHQQNKIRQLMILTEGNRISYHSTSIPDGLIKIIG